MNSYIKQQQSFNYWRSGLKLNQDRMLLVCEELLCHVPPLVGSRTFQLATLSSNGIHQESQANENFHQFSFP